jgi:hypothetical protein
VDFGHFQFEHALQQARMRPGEGDRRALGGPLHFNHIGLDPLVFVELLAGNLLVGHQNGLDALGELHIDRLGLRILTEHQAGHNIAFTAGVLFEDDAALGLANALHDHLFGGLSGNAAKVARGNFHFEDIAQAEAGILGAGFGQRSLQPVVLNLFDDFLLCVYPVVAGLGVKVDAHVLSGTEVTPVSRNQRCFDRLNKHFPCDAPLPYQIVKCLENLGLHLLSPPAGRSKPA